MEALEAERFDLIISDLYMPGHTGLEVIPKAQQKDPEVQAIILTASETAERSMGWVLV
jgi:two-component system NtrC family response regulator